jgi:Concanavalin A-like lectin/glucanases superfamily
MSNAYGSGSIVTNGLVLYLDGNNPKSIIASSSTWYDLSGSNSYAQGTLNYQPINNVGTLFFTASQYATANTSFSINGGITLEAFVYPSSVIQGGAVGFGLAGSEFALGIYPVSTYNVVLSQTDQFIGYGTGITKIYPNQWYHICAINSGSFTYHYVNGKFDYSYSSTAKISLPSAAIIGRWLGGSQSSIGNIGIARVYNRSLSVNEVNQNYNAQRTRFNI